MVHNTTGAGNSDLFSLLHEDLHLLKNHLLLLPHDLVRAVDGFLLDAHLP